MPANLSAFHYISADGPAWHRTGDAHSLITPEQLSADGRINFVAKKVPYCIPDGLGGYKQSQYGVAIVRDDTGEELSAASTEYECYQYSEFIEFVGGISQETGLPIRTAGTIDGGRKAWIMTTAPDGLVVGKSDEHQAYIGFMTSHDGSINLCAYAGSIRIVCQNTLNMFIQAGERMKTKIFSLRHTRNMRDSILAAKVELLKMLAQVKGMARIHNKLAEHEVKEADANRILKNAVDTIMVPNDATTKELKEILARRPVAYSLDDAIAATEAIPERIRRKRATTLELVIDTYEAERIRSANRYDVTDNAYLLANALTDIVERTGAYRGAPEVQAGKRFMDQMLGDRANQKLALYRHVADATIGRDVCNQILNEVLEQQAA